MIGPAEDGAFSGLDPEWDHARALYAQLKASYAPVVEVVGKILSGWGDFSPTERADCGAQFLAMVDETESFLRFVWLDCPNLPDELRAELEERL